VRAEAAGGEETACRCSADAEAEAVPAAGRRTSFAVGAEFGRAAGTDVPFEAGCISPAAVETLLVNEEIAQPAQEATSFACGVLIRGVFAVASAVAGGGNAVSAIEDENFRTR